MSATVGDATQAKVLCNDFLPAFNAVLSRLQLAIQESRQVQKKQATPPPASSKPDEDDDEPTNKLSSGDFVEMDRYLRDLMSSLQISRLSAELRALCQVIAKHADTLSSQSPNVAATVDVLSSMITQLTLPLRQYTLIVTWNLQQWMSFNRHTTRLEHHLISYLSNLFSKGFAKEEEQEAPKEGEEHQVNGTGMGDGEGDKDVSDQIENESQLEDLKGEEQGEKDKNKQKVSRIFVKFHDIQLLYKY